jgi:2-polyprenyl-3-methyl-5-hydroxy-6-metoxy-1,4-benzoquinol methylase
MSITLQERRLHAAQASGGTSTGVIKSLILRLIRQKNLRGSFLDFGAGVGELVRLLRPTPGVERVSGVDLLDRPEGLSADITWYQQDLNDQITLGETFDVVICSEVIEHLENPRKVLRDCYHLLKPGGSLILTMPNQESIRSYVGLLFGGHFTLFLGNCYPAHITALLRLDLVRICAETGFEPPSFYFTNHGCIPKATFLRWQSISFGLLRGRLFSDNIAMVSKRP